MIWGSQAQPGQPEYFFFDLLRKYVVVFGRTFSDIVIQRSVANNVVTDLKVPLEYAAKDKTIVRLEGDPDLDRPFSALLPIMTFEISGIAYDAPRKLTTLAKTAYRNPTDKNHFKVMYTPVPFNINFNLYVYTKNQEDGAKILEQIFPFFQPDWTPSIELVPELNETRDVPIEMVSPMGYEDLYDKDFKVRRIILYTLPFRMRAWFYGPIRNKAMIKFTTMNLRAGIFTNNAITLNYNSSNGNLQTNSTIFSYNVNGTVQGEGTIALASHMNGANGTLQVNVTSGSFASSNAIYTTGNTIVAQIPSSNGFINGIYDDMGNLLPNAGTAEYITGQPGETISGAPTNKISETIDWHLIDVDDDYGFASQIHGAAD